MKIDYAKPVMGNKLQPGWYWAFRVKTGDWSSFEIACRFSYLAHLRGFRCGSSPRTLTLRLRLRPVVYP